MTLISNAKGLAVELPLPVFTFYALDPSRLKFRTSNLPLAAQTLTADKDEE